MDGRSVQAASGRRKQVARYRDASIARTIARMPTPTDSGSFGQASITRASSALRGPEAVLGRLLGLPEASS